jgi:ethanolamine ammonia-lyase small subunit
MLARPRDVESSVLELGKHLARERRVVAHPIAVGYLLPVARSTASRRGWGRAGGQPAIGWYLKRYIKSKRHARCDRANV